MRSTFTKAAGLGVIAGIRSLSAPAFVSGHLYRGTEMGPSHSIQSFMCSPRFARALKIAAAGEIVADKLPIIPDRIAPVPLVGRIVSGAICGAAVCEAEGKRIQVGVVVGGLAAIGSAFAFYHIRKRISESTIVPDALLGLAEDAIVLAAGPSIFNDSNG